MAQQDKLEVEKSEAKNNVEEYVYEMRDKISMGLENFINEQVRVWSQYVAMVTCFRGDGYRTRRLTNHY